MEANNIQAVIDFNDDYSVQCGERNEPRPYPTREALEQLGSVIMTEVLDVLMGTALEDQLGTICEAVIGGFHSAAGRIERDADRARGELNRAIRDFDGTEIADVELQELNDKAKASDVAQLAVEMVRDAAAATYTAQTGEVWTAWRGTVKGNRTTAAMIDGRDALRTAKQRRSGQTDPGQAVVAFRGSPMANTEQDAHRIFDALNWAQKQWPHMALATSGAKGAEQLAIKWANQKRIKLILCRADFDRHNKAAPFRANDDLLELEPVCLLTLANTLNPERAKSTTPFGPAANIAEKAREKGLRHQAIR